MAYEVKQMHYGPQWKRLAGGFARRSAAEAWLFDKFRDCIVDRDVDERTDAISYMVIGADGLFHEYMVAREGTDD